MQALKAETLQIPSFLDAMGNLSVTGSPQQMATNLSIHTQHACNKSISRRKAFCGAHSPTFWWTAEIAIEALSTGPYMRTARSGTAGSRWTLPHATLDVRNAFNSAIWDNILYALMELNIPPCLIRIIGSYFRQRKLKYHTDDGGKQYLVIGGVPQRSVLGPKL